MSSSLMTTAGIIIAVTGAIIGLQQVVIPLVKKGRLMFSTWTDFIRDWNGEPAGSGREEIPGVMARLNRLDGELTHNGGSSLKDAVQRLEVNQENIYKKIEEAETQRKESQDVILAAIAAISPAVAPLQVKTTKVRSTKNTAIKKTK